MTDDPEYGPAIAKLDRRRQRFVVLLLQDDRFGAGARSAKAAGFGNPGSSAATYARIAHRLRSQKLVVDAIEEESRKQFRSLAPDALRVVKQVLSDPKNKYRLRVALEILGRVDPTSVNVEHDHRHEHVHRSDRDADIESLRFLRDVCGVPREGLERVFGYSGIGFLETREKSQTPLLIEGEVVDDNGAAE